MRQGDEGRASRGARAAGSALVVGLALVSCAPGNVHDKFGAAVACQELVERRLKAPATADFPTVNPAAIDSGANAIYQVTSYVDAQNGFGAQIRTNYTCKVQYQASDSSWNLLDIDL